MRVKASMHAGKSGLGLAAEMSLSPSLGELIAQLRWWDVAVALNDGIATLFINELGMYSKWDWEGAFGGEVHGQVMLFRPSLMPPLTEEVGRGALNAAASCGRRGSYVTTLMCWRQKLYSDCCAQTATALATASSYCGAIILSLFERSARGRANPRF